MQPQLGVPRVGRNDPCPCGSGKKYKHCHLLLEQQATLNTIVQRRVREMAFQKLAAYVQGERFVPDVMAATNLFWDGRLADNLLPQVSPLHRLRSLDYFLFDYRTAEGDRIIDRFVVEHNARLSAEERAALKLWAKAYIGIYAVQKTDADYVYVRDLLLGGEKRVQSALPPPIANPSMALIGRLIPDTPAYFSQDLVLPMAQTRANELIEWLKPKYAGYQAQHYGAKWPDFLRAASQLFNHFLLEDPEFLPAPPSPVTRPDANAELKIAQTAIRQLHSGLIIGSLDQHYSQWLDRPIEGWGHQSPRQLMADDLGKARVDLLLKVLEGAEEDRRALRQPAYDVNRLRAQLGMMGPGVF